MIKKGDIVWVASWAYKGYLEGVAVFKTGEEAEKFVVKLRRNCCRRKAGDATLEVFYKRETIQ